MCPGAATSEHQVEPRWNSSSTVCAGPGGRLTRVAAGGSAWTVVRVRFPRGCVHETAGSAGLGAVVASAIPAMKLGDGRHLADTVESLGGQIRAEFELSECYVELSCPANVSAPCLDLLSLAIEVGRLDSPSIRSAVGQVIQRSTERRLAPADNAVDRIRQIRLGDWQPSRTSLGDRACLLDAAASPDLVAEAWEDWRKLPAEIVVTNASAEEHAMPILHRPTAEPPAANSPPLPRYPRRAELPVDIDCDQTTFAWGGLLPVRTPADVAHIEMMMALIAGTPASRWYQTYRQRLGISYGSGASVQVHRLGRTWAAEYLALMTVDKQASGTVEHMLPGQLECIAENGFGEDELWEARRSVSMSGVLPPLSSASAVNRVVAIPEFPRRGEFCEQYRKALDQVRAESLNDWARLLMADGSLMQSAGEPRTTARPVV